MWEDFMGVCLRMDRLVLIEFDLRLVWFMLFMIS